MSLFTSILSEKGAFYSRAGKIAAQVLEQESNCVVIGAAKGKLADIILDNAPKGDHYLFEPNPVLREELEKRYTHYNCNISAHILSDKQGAVQRTYKLPVAIKIDKKRGKGEQYKIVQTPTEVEVPVERLDDLVPEGYNAALIVVNTNENLIELLNGAQQTVERAQPHFIFEKGLGNSQVASSVYRYMADNKLRISTLSRWIGNKPSFQEKEFIQWLAGNIGTPLIVYP